MHACTLPCLRGGSSYLDSSKHELWLLQFTCQKPYRGLALLCRVASRDIRRFETSDLRTTLVKRLPQNTVCHLQGLQQHLVGQFHQSTVGFIGFSQLFCCFQSAAASTLACRGRLQVSPGHQALTHSAKMDLVEHKISFLDLTDPCIVALLQHNIECTCSAGDGCSSSCFCSLDYRSFFSAARAHPKLHRAASVALRRVSATLRQLQLDNFQLYLENHSQQLKDLALSCRVHLRELPHTLRLDSLKLNGVSVQLSQASSNSHAG